MPSSVHARATQRPGTAGFRQRSVSCRLPFHARNRAGKKGQAIIETVLVSFVLGLIFFAAMQLSLMFAAREVNRHAANAGVRAKAVGFNDFMVHKVVRVASIPNAGKMTTPTFTRTPNTQNPFAPVHLQWQQSLQNQPRSPQLGIETSRIPLYLGGQRQGELDAILDYEHFTTIRHSENSAGVTVGVTTRQDFPLVMPFHSWFNAGDTTPLHTEAYHADHYSLYLE